MCITNRKSETKLVGRDAMGAIALDEFVRRWRATSWGIRKALVGIRDPRLRAEIQRLLDAHWMGKAHEPMRLPEERSEALATMCEGLLRQFDDERAGAAEIRLIIHKRDELPTEPASAPPPDPTAAVEAENDALVWELRQLIASSGGTIADVANVLERRGDVVDDKGRELLQDEVRSVEVDIAVLKTLLSDAVDWDAECTRLLADEVPPFEDPLVESDDEEDE